MHRRRSTYLAIIAGSVAVIAAILFSYDRAIKNSKEEYTSPTHASFSSDDSRKFGSFVCAVQPHPGYMGWNGKRTPIVEAWIEHPTQIRYRFLFFKTRENLDRYRLVIRPDFTGRDIEYIPIVGNNGYFALQSSGIRGSVVYSYELGRVYDSTMYFRVVDSLSDESSVMTMTVSNDEQ